MKSKVKVRYVQDQDITLFEEKVNKEIEAIQVNIKNRIKEVSTIKQAGDMFIAQILYEEVEEPIVLNE